MCSGLSEERLGLELSTLLQKEDCGKNGFVKDPMYCPILCGVCPGELSTVPSVECVTVSCVFCPILCGVCPDELCVLYCVFIVQRTGRKIGPK